ncbi:MAG: 4Fe-4S binding protein, partial [Desulfobacterales bacterium]
MAENERKTVIPCGRPRSPCLRSGGQGSRGTGTGYLDFDHPVKTDFRRTGDRCITCGACANNCPNDAMKIEDRDGEQILSL